MYIYCKITTKTEDYQMENSKLSFGLVSGRFPSSCYASRGMTFYLMSN